MRELQERRGTMPAYKKELIDWLDGFRGTRRLIEIVVTQGVTPQEAAAWMNQWEKWLVPKKQRSNRGA